jgi:hypothetical protein
LVHAGGSVFGFTEKLVEQLEINDPVRCPGFEYEVAEPRAGLK